MVTVQEFVNFTTFDLKCTNKSEFPLNINKYRQFVNQINDTIEVDKGCLNKIKKGVKTIYNSGSTHCQDEILFSELLEKICQNEDDSSFDVEGDKISSGLTKFAVVMRDLSNKYQQLMQNLNSLMVYPMDMFLKSYLKHDAKKPFEKALKDYEAKAEKLKKDRLNALTKENASTIYRPNGDDLFDFSEDLEKERRIVQLQLCEFLIKANEMKARRGSDLVQQLIDFYRAQINYFKDSLSMMEHMGLFMNDLVHHIDEIKGHHSEDIQLLANVRKDLKSIIDKSKNQSSTTAVGGLTGTLANTTQSSTGQTVSNPPQGYSLHQPQGNKAYGTTKDGYLLKKSDGMVKRVWQKRRVKVCDQSLLLYHGDDSKPPVILPMLTCHIKHPIANSQNDPETSCCFELISNNRKYNFRAEDDKTLEEWISVLSNAKSAVFEQAMSLDANEDDEFDDNLSTTSNTVGGTVANPTNSSNTPNMSQHNNNALYYGNNTSTVTNNNLMTTSTMSFGQNLADGNMASDVSPVHFRKAIIKTIRKLEGNDKCVDCGAPDPDWVSVNLGVLICLNCCGVHRELGVHLSRTQSLKMDTFYLSQLLLPRFIGNKMFNSVFEANLPDDIKPNCSDTTNYNKNESPVTMEQRRDFIQSKYVNHKYVEKCNSDNLSYLKHDLLQSIQQLDIKSLLQTYAEDADMMHQFTVSDDQEIGPLMNSCLHELLREADNFTTTNSQTDNNNSASKRLFLYDLNWEDDTRLKNNVAILVITEFILQNSTSASLKRLNSNGDSILHQSIKSKQLDASKIILRSGTISSDLLNSKNNDGKTPSDLIEDLISADQYNQFHELFKSAKSTLTNSISSSDKDRFNELLDELNIDWGLFNTQANYGGGSCGYNTIGSHKSKYIMEDIKSQGDSRKGVSDRIATHIRSESQSSSKSDAAYVNFNALLSNASSSAGNTSGFSSERKSSIHSVGCVMTPPIANTNNSNNNSSALPNSYKHSFLSYNPDQKIGIKSSNAPWKEFTTLPRKKSLKGPAPEPPLNIQSKESQPVKTKSSHSNPISSLIRPKSSFTSAKHQDNINQTSSRPFIAPKPRASIHSTDIHSMALPSNNKPQPKMRTMHNYSTSDYGTGSNTVIVTNTYTSTSNSSTNSSSCSNFDYANATLPRNMHSIIKESKQSGNTNSMKHNSQLSHSSDHIDVLLDVLEEPDKPLNAQEVELDDSPICSNVKSERSATVTTSNFTLSKYPVRNMTNLSFHDSDYSNNPKKSSVTINHRNKQQPLLQTGDRTTAQYNCTAEHSDELSFNRGDIIIVSKNTSDDGWWEGYLESDPTKKGLFPGNFIKKI